MKSVSSIVVGVVVVVAAGGAALWMQHRPAPEATVEPASAAPPAAPPPAPAPSAPAIRYPVAAGDAASAPPADVAQALDQLFGRAAVARFFQAGDFPHRFVATVDNLGRGAAPANAWPVNPTRGRFLVRGADGGMAVAPDNALRYAAVIELLEQADLPRAVADYRTFYPQFQQAYEALGFPGKYFNDRLVDVLDLLIAAPEPAGPLQVELPAIRGPSAPARPWVLYEFTDPALAALPAGQKLLVRMGLANERRVKKRLAELRARLVAPADARSAR